MQLAAIPALQDNYIWVLHSEHAAVAVDPGVAAPVRGWLAATGRRLTAILVTHHHLDHTGGIAELVKRYQVPVIGPAHERQPIPHLSQPLQDDDLIELPGLGVEMTAIAVPGHTLGATALYGAGVVLTGDTLFSAGCGRLFEGTPAMMHDSLQRLAALPGDTQVCCGHEYTQSNLAFARSVEPDNAAVLEHALLVKQQRAAGKPSLPSTLALELRINPFLRCEEPAVRAAAEAQAQQSLADARSVFAALRHWKDHYRAPLH